MQRAHVLAMSFLRNPAWYLKRHIALIDRCLNGVIYGRQRGREDIRKEKRLTTFQQPPMESLVSDTESIYREQWYDGTKVLGCAKRRWEIPKGKKKNRWWKVCRNILLHGPCLPQRQWLSIGSGKADCAEVKGQLRGERDTRRQVGRGRNELRMPNFQREGPIVVTTKSNFSWYRIYEAFTHVWIRVCAASQNHARS